MPSAGLTTPRVVRHRGAEQHSPRLDRSRATTVGAGMTFYMTRVGHRLPGGQPTVVDPTSKERAARRHARDVVISTPRQALNQPMRRQRAALSSRRRGDGRWLGVSRVRDHRRSVQKSSWWTSTARGSLQTTRHRAVRPSDDTAATRSVVRHISSFRRFGNRVNASGSTVALPGSVRRAGVQDGSSRTTANHRPVDVSAWSTSGAPRSPAHLGVGSVAAPPLPPPAGHGWDGVVLQVRRGSRSSWRHYQR
jgi:hypothetical protein